jgi:predicted transcriptional regulator of viral defense system
MKGNIVMKYIRRQLSDNESFLLKYIIDNELLWFYFDTLKSLELYDAGKLQDILSRLTKAEYISRIEKGLYCIRNFRNSYVIANAMLKNSSIAYWSALNIHGLTEQIPNIIYSQSDYLKNSKKVFGVTYKFVKVKPEKIFGTIQMGYGNETFKITDVEKTLLDCFDLPQYSGGYEELIRAFYTAKIDRTKLLKYGTQIGNLSVLKRMAFLSELFQMEDFSDFQESVLKIVNKKYTLLDPFSENTGKFDSKWRIRINIQKDALLDMINKVY